MSDNPVLSDLFDPLQPRRWPDPVTLPIRLPNRPVACSSAQVRSESGTLPPFSASFCITCLCSQMFIWAESFASPV
jgi:hypothetical protein